MIQQHFKYQRIRTKNIFALFKADLDDSITSTDTKITVLNKDLKYFKNTTYDILELVSSVLNTSEIDFITYQTATNQLKQINYKSLMITQMKK